MLLLFLFLTVVPISLGHINSSKHRKFHADENLGRDEHYTYNALCMLDGKPQIIPGFDCRKMIAVGRYKNSINTTGWSYLEIETKSEFDPDIQAYSAGVLEGILTKDVLALHLENTINDYCIGYKGYCKKLGGYLKQKMGWIQEQIENAPKEDVYWQAVKRIFLQLTGLWHGYKGKQFNVSISYDIHPIM
jgi:hypothetical protein